MLMVEFVGKGRSEGDDSDSGQTQEDEKWNMCLVAQELEYTRA